MPTKTVFLMHKRFARCRIIAARLTSTSREFLVETNERDPGDSASKQRFLLVNEDFWNEYPETLSEVFDQFSRDSEHTLVSEMSAIPETHEQEPIPPEIHHRNRELDLSGFDEEDGYDAEARDTCLQP